MRYPEIRTLNGKQVGETQMNIDNKTQINTNNRKGQSSLEMTVALIAVFVLCFGSVNMFIWLNERMVLRQEGYEATRVAAASDNPGIEVDESGYPQLDIFGENTD